MDVVFGGRERTGRENTELATYEAVANPELKKYTLVMMKYIYMTAFAWLFTTYAFIANAQDFDRGAAFYQNGNVAAALNEWRPLAEQGHAVAQFNLGRMYYNGKGVPKDVAEATRWYRLAAEQGRADAQNNLGIIYAMDRDLYDVAEAVRWFRLAAEQGLAVAQFNLGAMYASGSGVEKDMAEAVRWYHLAAEQGDVKAQFRLGYKYANGEGVLKDAITAHMWYTISVRRVRYNAFDATHMRINAFNATRMRHKASGTLTERRRDKLEAEMTPEQIATAVQRAKTSMSSNYAQCD